MPQHAAGGMGEKLERNAPDDARYVQRFSAPFEYAVYFTRSVFDLANPVFVQALSSLEPSRRHRLLAVIDHGVAEAWPNLARDLGRYCKAHSASLQLLERPLIVPGGEQAKQAPALIHTLQQHMQRLGVDRQSFVVAIGGGAMLDAVGYAAATTHRGVRLVRLPTTVLGQNDSGVGVKNGINAFGAKNFLGTFAAPFAVINDTAFLQTLSARDRRSGMAEAVKVALIRDGRFFEWLEEHAANLRAFEEPAILHLVRTTAELHLRHIATAGDPFEQGSARPLDFGHWAAHKLESLTDHALRHGEAVAIGMALDTRYSFEVGLLSEACMLRIFSLLEELGFRLWDDALAHVDQNEQPRLLEGLREFREHLGGELTVTLLTGIGFGVEVHDIAHKTVLTSLAWLGARDAARGHAA